MTSPGTCLRGIFSVTKGGGGFRWRFFSRKIFSRYFHGSIARRFGAPHVVEKKTRRVIDPRGISCCLARWWRCCGVVRGVPSGMTKGSRTGSATSLGVTRKRSNPHSIIDTNERRHWDNGEGATSMGVVSCRGVASSIPSCTRRTN